MVRPLSALALCLLTAVEVAAQAKPRPPAPAKPAAPEFYTTALTLAEMAGKQAVVETDKGVFVLQLLPEAAPNHVGYFIEQARQKGFDGTTFHSMIKYGIVQGGDPLSRDPSQRDQYGTGGLGVLRAELNAEKTTRGAVAASLRPGAIDSAGSQFFICVTDQPGLEGKYTVFARVVEDIEVVQRISETPVDDKNKATERVAIKSVTIRDTPPPTAPPFAAATPAELGTYRAVLETTMGKIAIEFFPDLAPNHVRNFLRLAQIGAYDGTAFHRVAPGFVIQTGSMAHRSSPLTEKQQRWVPSTLAPEFNAMRHEKGIVSMARGAAPESASTSFFICTNAAPSLDNQYTAFGRVVDGLDIVEAIEKVPTQGETPVTRVELVTVRLERSPR